MVALGLPVGGEVILQEAVAKARSGPHLVGLRLVEILLAVARLAKLLLVGAVGVVGEELGVVGEATDMAVQLPLARGSLMFLGTKAL